MEDTRQKVYVRKPGATHVAVAPLPTLRGAEPRAASQPRREVAAPGADPQREADRLALARYAPASVLINADLEITQFRGETSPYLAPSPRQARLKQELAATREYLQSVIEQQEADNEELQSSNEEVQSANEELQSTNEELETSKEEIQSSNEELATVNEELKNRNLELGQSNNDFVNLLASVELPIVMLGADLRIRRFTPMAEKLFNLIPADVGRPITDITLHVDLPDLEQMLDVVVETARGKRHELPDTQRRWYLLRLRPYRTLENRIDGVVLVLIDVDTF